MQRQQKREVTDLHVDVMSISCASSGQPCSRSVTPPPPLLALAREPFDTNYHVHELPELEQGQ